MSEPIKILSWNVNGIRAVYKKGFLDWLKKESPDILCVQETKASPVQLPEELANPEGYHSQWNWAEKKGYSGVATFSKHKPGEVEKGFGISSLDGEGRFLSTDFGAFVLFNIYFPNGKKDEERLNFKLWFYDEFLKHIDLLKKKGRKIVFCGDVNTAHMEIDLSHPKLNQSVSGFLPVERQWLDKLASHGYIDTFRQFNKEPFHYTWWDYKTGARERNIGWRLDYFYISENMAGNLKKAFIKKEVEGSDHCPVGIELSGI